MDKNSTHSTDRVFDYEDMRIRRNRSNPVAQHLGVDLTVLREGYAEAEIPIQDFMRNPVGSVHGGIHYTLADIAASAAAYSHGDPVSTMNCDYQYLRAALADCTRLIASAVEVKYGRRVSVVRVEVKDQNGKLLSMGTFTIAFLPKDKDRIQ